MKVYMVASALPTWMRTGYGHSLLAADATDVLVSFVDFMKPANPHSLTLESMPVYVPAELKPGRQVVGPDVDAMPV